MKQTFKKLLGLTLSAALLLSGISVYSAPAASSDGIIISDSAELYQEGSCTPMPSYLPSGKGTSIKSASTLTYTGVDKVIYDGLYNCETNINISKYKLSQTDVNNHIQYILNSCPEFFYVDSNYQLSSVKNEIVAYKPRYNLSGSELTEARNYFQAQMNQILSHVNPDWSDLEKIVFVHDYLAQHFEYDTSLSIYDAYNFFLNGKGVCQAYTLTFNGLMNELGIECSYATSDAMKHIWNLVCLNGKWYHIDVTWDDPTDDQFGLAQHENLLLSDNAINTCRGSSSQNHHSWTSSYTCTDTSYDSYFWESSTSPFQYLDGTWYYTSYNSTDKTSALYSYNFTTKKSSFIYSMDKWYSGTGSNTFSPSCYSGLSAYNGILYFNNYNTILSYTASAGVKTAYKPNITTAIYGMRTEDGKLYYKASLSSDPSDNTKKLYSINLDAEKLPYASSAPAPESSAAPSAAPAASAIPGTTASRTPAASAVPGTTASRTPAASAVPGTTASRTPAASAVPGTTASRTPAASAVPGTTASGSPAASTVPGTVTSQEPAVSKAPAVNNPQAGDVDTDGSITLSDAQLTLKIALKLFSPSPQQTILANVDGDATVTLADAQLILKRALKLINSF